MPIGDNAFGDVVFGDGRLALLQQAAPIVSGIFPIGTGGMLIDYIITDQSNAIYDIIGVFMVGMVGRKIR